MKIRFLSAANQDVRSVLDYYLLKAGASVATDFHEALEEIIERIRRSPNSFPLIDDLRRRALLKRFPYQVIYRVEAEDALLIIGVRHDKQNQNFGLDR
ncbi:MAG: type II toxin-antitoxin system RelE/ParE family toxin [Acidobacteriota bacterium]|nr:MAG: type II toxin-antitoxin system RelE/ParE family toxin [Acidobacteriota bacterium]